MITFNDSEEWKAAIAASGVDRFIPKDCLRQELPGAIAQLFSGRAGAAEEVVGKSHDMTFPHPNLSFDP